jgi:hypothetical protein
METINSAGAQSSIRIVLIVALIRQNHTSKDGVRVALFLQRIQTKGRNDYRREGNAMSRLTAMTTGELWDSIGSQNMDEALAKLRRDGWAKVAVDDADISYLVLIRDRAKVRIYARSSLVGMIDASFN